MKKSNLFQIKPKAPKKKTETTEMYRAMGAINQIPGCRVFRNNVGQLKDSRGIPVTFGLAVGSADLIGSVMYGANAIPIFIEFKRPGKERSEDQEAWCNTMITLGWHGGVATTVDEALAIVEGARKRLTADAGQLAAEYRRGAFDERMAVRKWLASNLPLGTINLAETVLRGGHITGEMVSK